MTILAIVNRQVWVNLVSKYAYFEGLLWKPWSRAHALVFVRFLFQFLFFFKANFLYFVLCKFFFKVFEIFLYLNFILFLNFFEQIFEHINCPLSGLILELRKPKSKDQQGVLLVSALLSTLKPYLCIISFNYSLLLLWKKVCLCIRN